MTRWTAAVLAGAVLMTTGPATAAAGASDRPDPRVSHAHEDSYYPTVGDPSIDALHYGIDLRWDDRSRTLTETTSIHFRAPHAEDHVVLDLERQLAVSAVQLDGQPVTYSHDGKDLTVQTGPLDADSRHTLVVSDAGQAQPAPFPGKRSDLAGGVGWTVTKGGQTWTVQEPYGAFTWFPCHDQPSDKATYDITSTTKSGWHSAANGRLLSDRVHDGLRTSHFRLTSPAATYLVTLATGPYRHYTQRGPHGLPLSYWVRPGDRKLLPKLRRSAGVLRWLEKRLGPYPFSTAGAVVVPADTAEETQTLLTMGNFGGDYYVSTLAHEYAHAWYGDTVTPLDWRDLWLNESFATYVETEWDAAHGVQKERIARQFMDYFDQKYRNRGGPPGRYDRDDFADSTVYYCGARMLFELRDRVGKRAFGRLLRAWPQQHRFGTATRQEWITFADRVTHRHLDGFIHHWLNATKSPKG